MTFSEGIFWTEKIMLIFEIRPEEIIIAIAILELNC